LSTNNPYCIYGSCVLYCCEFRNPLPLAATSNQTSSVMKKLFCFLIICSIAVVPLKILHAEKSPSQFFSIGLNVSNGTSDMGAIYLYGPTNVSAYLNPNSGSSYGPLTAGNYTVNMYASAPGSRTFVFGSQSVTTTTGSATFNVNITGTVFAYIY
jgi:hypothetical protein